MDPFVPRLYYYNSNLQERPVMKNVGYNTGRAKGNYYRDS